MSKKRYVNTKFWSDGFVVGLDPIDRYLFLYLLTNEHTDICGIYELPFSVMARETNLDINQLTEILKRLEDKVTIVNDWVYINNFVKNQAVNDSIKQGIERSYALIPDNVLAKIREKDSTLDCDTLVHSDTDCDTLVHSDTDCDILKPKPKLKLKPKLNIVDEVDEGVDKSTKKKPVKSDRIPNLLVDKQKHVQIVGHFAIAKNIEFKTKKQQQDFIKRNIKAGSILAEYEIPRIIEVMTYLDKNASFKWTLETVYKYIDEDLKDLKPSQGGAIGGYVGPTEQGEGFISGLPEENK